MKLPKYNLGYNTRDQLRSLAISASERKHGFLFIFLFLRLEKSLSLRFIPVSKFLTVAQNHSQSDKSRPSASILVLFPTFDTARHLHVSVCVFLKNVSSLKKNPWRKHGNYLTSTATRAPSAPMCLGLPFWRPSYFTLRGAVAPLPPRPARHCCPLMFVAKGKDYFKCKICLITQKVNEPDHE